MRPILLLLLLVLLAAAAPADRPAERATPEQSPAAQAAIAAVAAAWRLGDHEALSRLVSSGGADVALGPAPDRDVHYSRSQAYYFFKSYFRSRRTESFSLERLQPLAGGERIHALAGWIWRRDGAAEPEAERLLLALVPEAEGWRLAEIRALR